jgi:putative tryptophan/tyrosine transport system substrate-binding protein
VRARYPGARFLARHANGNSAEYGTVVNAAIAARPTLLAPITTPITQLTVERARGRTPIVFMGVTDPVGATVARSIETPGIATGSSDLCPFDALLSLTRKAFPAARTLGLPYNPADQPAVFGRSELRRLASAAGFEVRDRQVTDATELRFAVTSLANESEVIVIAADNIMMENPGAIVEAAAAQGKPTVACDAASVTAGAVAGVSVDYRDVGEAAGAIAVRVLQGEAPGNIPVSVLRDGGIALNLNAACRLRVPLDSSVRASAVRTIGTPDCGELTSTIAASARAAQADSTGVANGNGTAPWLYWLGGGLLVAALAGIILRMRGRRS